jgi:hypothetical protein
MEFIETGRVTFGQRLGVLVAGTTKDLWTQGRGREHTGWTCGSHGKTYRDKREGGVAARAKLSTGCSLSRQTNAAAEGHSGDRGRMDRPETVLRHSAKRSWEQEAGGRGGRRISYGEGRLEDHRAGETYSRPGGRQRYCRRARGGDAGGGASDARWPSARVVAAAAAARAWQATWAARAILGLRRRTRTPSAAGQCGALVEISEKMKKCPGDIPEGGSGTAGAAVPRLWRTEESRGLPGRLEGITARGAAD